MRIREERWCAEELAGGRLGAARLDRRLRQLGERLAAGVGETLPLACQAWAGPPAAARFFSHARGRAAELLRGHCDAPRRRFAARAGPIRVLHDPPDWISTRRRSEAGGFTPKVSRGKDKRGRARRHTVWGLVRHTSLAATAEGGPRGRAAARFGPRKKCKERNARKRKLTPPRGPIEGQERRRWRETLRPSPDLLGEPARGVHLCDRAGASWAWLCLAAELSPPS